MGLQRVRHDWATLLTLKYGQTLAYFLLNTNLFSLSKLLLFSHSVMSNFASPWTAACQTSLSFSISQNVLKVMSMEPTMPSNHLIFCHPLLLLPSIFPRIRVFSSESVLHSRWPKNWSFSFRISPCNEYSGLISFRIDWFDLLAAQVTLKRPFQA